MSKDQLSELIKSLSAYLICAQPELAIVDRPSLDQAIAHLRYTLEKMP